MKQRGAFSVYVEAGKARLLFDIGPDPEVLRANARRLGIDLTKMDFIVISHVHGDHTGGFENSYSRSEQSKFKIASRDSPYALNLQTSTSKFI